MATLTVPDVPDGLHRKVKALARCRHRSFGQEVIRLLTVALHAEAPPGMLVAKHEGTRGTGPVEQYAMLLMRGRGFSVVDLDRPLLRAAARVRGATAGTDPPAGHRALRGARERRVLHLADHPLPR